jgi:hypothetical protein
MECADKQGNRTELIERKGDKGYEMFCPKCGGSKIYWAVIE